MHYYFVCTILKGFFNTKPITYYITDKKNHYVIDSNILLH